MDEIWKPVNGYEGAYEVSDHGNVRSIDRVDHLGRKRRGRNLAIRPLPNGRPRVSLARYGKAVDAYPYVLVLEAFICPRPLKMMALHWDDDPNNNHLSNLRWGTRTDNMRDMSRNGSGNAGLTHCPSGHEYNEANTYVYPGPRKHRLCRECQHIRSAKRWLRKLEHRKAA